MKKEERLKVIETDLRKLSQSEASMQIFASVKKQVQFAGGKEMGFLRCSLAGEELSEDQKNQLQTHSFHTLENELDKKIYCQRDFDLGELKEATQVTERIFSEFYGLSGNYDLYTELDL